MWTTQALVKGNSFEICDDKLKEFNGRQITVTIMIPESRNVHSDNAMASLNHLLSMPKRIPADIDYKEEYRKHLDSKYDNIS